MESRSTSTPRSTSGSKRSNTNLSNLRLAPLSTKFAEPAQHHNRTAQSPYDQSPGVAFSRHHSSYLQDRSAPTTPGILSRTASRRRFDGGLSRRSSLYEEDNDVPYQYAAVTSGQPGWLRGDAGNVQVPKARSEAALHVQRKLSAEGALSQKHHNIRSKTGTSSPVARRRPRDADDDWLTRTRASTNALLQESKGQSWLASRDSLQSLAHLNSDDSDDEGYEEMAAISANHTRLQVEDDVLSPAAARVNSPAWGSRYGSRAVSRRTSRRPSMSALRTPRMGSSGSAADYFDDERLAFPTEPDFVDPEFDESTDEREVAKLTGLRSFGLGAIVDRLMEFNNLFDVEEREETTEDEADRGGEISAEMRDRVAAEAKQKRELKAQALPSTSSPGRDDKSEQEEGGWQDAAWLLSVASRALF